jgi:type VI secretion system FHA domain protein
MELVLTIQGGDSPEQEAYSHRFDETGGTIGRSPRNDWMLNDPDRYVSERHAQIRFHDGYFVLTDLSTNGTYINDDRRRIPKHASVPLKSGDQVTMGNLLIDVTVLGARARSRELSPGERDLRKSPRDSTIPRRASRDHEPPGDREMPHRAVERRGAELPPSPRETGSPDIPDEWRDLIAGFFEPGPDLHEQEDRRPRDRSSSPHPSDDELAARAILRELGIPDIADQVDPEAFGRDVGRILKMVIEGLMNALQTRAEVKNKFRIEQTQMRAAGNNPLKSSADLETAVRRLLLDTEDSKYIRGASAFREAFDDLRTHELAVLTAVHASIEAVIANFDPRPLKKKLRRIAPISAATPILNNAKCWSLYEDHYQDVAAQLRDDARLGFLKEFANAYEAAAQQLRAESNRDEPND